MASNILITVPSYSFVYDKKLLKTTLRQAGQEVAKIDRALLRGKGAGRKYGKHQASAPGSPAAKRTGALANAVRVRVSKNGESVRVIENQFYSRFLEVGAKGGGRQRRGGGSARTKRGAVQTRRILLPRPSLAVAVKQVEGNLQERIVNALSRSVEFRPGKAPRIKT